MDVIESFLNNCIGISLPLRTFLYIGGDWTLYRSPSNFEKEVFLAAFLKLDNSQRD